MLLSLKKNYLFWSLWDRNMISSLSRNTRGVWLERVGREGQRHDGIWPKCWRSWLLSWVRWERLSSFFVEFHLFFALDNCQNTYSYFPSDFSSATNWFPSHGYFVQKLPVLCWYTAPSRWQWICFASVISSRFLIMLRGGGHVNTCRHSATVSPDTCLLQLTQRLACLHWTSQTVPTGPLAPLPGSTLSAKGWMTPKSVFSIHISQDRKLVLRKFQPLAQSHPAGWAQLQSLMYLRLACLWSYF